MTLQGCRTQAITSFLIVSIGAAAVPGCSIVLEGQKTQCEAAADCGEGRFQCLDGLCVAAEPFDCFDEVPRLATDELTLSITVIDALTLGNLPANIKICAATDLLCATPLQDKDVIAGEPEPFSVTRGTAGLTYRIEIESPDYVPTFFSLDGAVLASDSGEIFLDLYKTSDFDLLANQASGGETSADLVGAGQIVFQILDCARKQPAGVRFDLLSSTAPGWYTRNLVPSPLGTALEAEGLGGFLNVRPGLAQLRVTDADGAELAQLNPLIREGWVNRVLFAPQINPEPN